MSMILDALRRSREESRRGDKVPSLEVEHEVTALTKPGPSPWLIAVLGLAALGLALGVGGWLLSAGEPAGTPAQSNAAQTPPGDSPPVTASEPASRDVQVARGAADPRPPNPTATPDPRVAALYADTGTYTDTDTGTLTDTQTQTNPGAAPAAADLSADTDPGAESAQPDPESGTDDSEGSAPAANESSEQAARVEVDVEETAIDFEEVLRRAQREFGQPALVPHPAPLIDSLSQQKKNAIPTVLYTVHDYGGDGEAAVVLNGRRLVAGDRVDGFRVVTVLVDSVVLNHGGTEFRLRALNSWVNL